MFSMEGRAPVGGWDRGDGLLEPSCLRTAALGSWELPKIAVRPGEPQARWLPGLEFGQQLGTYIVR